MSWLSTENFNEINIIVISSKFFFKDVNWNLLQENYLSSV
jgi:hypothetical protein